MFIAAIPSDKPVNVNIQVKSSIFLKISLFTISIHYIVKFVQAIMERRYGIEVDYWTC